jgi:hypothetical protein
MRLDSSNAASLAFLFISLVFVVTAAAVDGLQLLVNQ